MLTSDHPSCYGFGGLAELAPPRGLERVRHPEVLALEIGRLQLAHCTLWDWYHDPDFPMALHEAIETLRAGRGMTSFNEPLPVAVAGFEAVMIVGGRTDENELGPKLTGLPCEVFFGKDGVFAGERGGFDILHFYGLSGWVLDLGKSQMKLSAPSNGNGGFTWRWIFRRDLTRLRMAWNVASFEVPSQRRRLREFIALRLQMAMAETGTRPDALVCGLPTRVPSDGIPRRSSYAGMGNDQTLLSDALDLAGLPGLPVLVLNDAELAAFSARSDPRLADFRKVLVVTLGSGIGAALINRSR